MRTVYYYKNMTHQSKLTLLAIGISAVVLCSALYMTSPQKNSVAGSSAETQPPSSGKVVDKIEVVHFHATQQCWSCITVGEYALKTIKEKFPEEYSKGMITFQDVNGELPENRDLVIKYQARGSSLFINTITDGEDNISEEITVWRLVGSEVQFTKYFEGKLRKILEA